MTRERAGSVKRGTPVIPAYTDSAMGIPVVLKKSVIRAEHDGAPGIIVPDLKGLEAAMAVARVMIERKLNGEEIRFLRKALDLKAMDMASHLDVSPETFSRWENNRDPISTNAERLLRLRVLRALRAQAPGVPGRLDDVLDMKISPARIASDPSTMIFERLLVLNEADSQVKQVWCFRGLESVAEATSSRRKIA